jgi:carboxyl-terminal processing protease
MLRDIEKELRKRYFDPGFRGKDLDAIFARARSRMAAATSEGQISGILVQALLDLEDSHTFFIPPPLSFSVDYGFEMGMVGERCVVTAVDRGSPAEAQGLVVGTRVLYVEGSTPTRENLWQIRYALEVARPRRELRLGIQVPGGSPENKVVAARVSPARPHRDFEEWIVERLPGRRGTPDPVRVVDLSESASLLRVPFFDAPERLVDDALERVRDKPGLVLDLRNNPGGSIERLERLAGSLLEGGAALAEQRGRQRVEPLVARRQPPSRVFRGRLAVLVDAQSASAAEILARALQIAGRGRVIGDRTAGDVMVSRQRAYTQGHQHRFLFYGLSITEADLVMSDGGRLEGVGMTPDEVVLPTPSDMAARRDPALAVAAAHLGVSLDPAAAGRLLRKASPR